jgi:hypothetical protein
LACKLPGACFFLPSSFGFMYSAFLPLFLQLRRHVYVRRLRALEPLQ